MYNKKKKELDKEKEKNKQWEDKISEKIEEVDKQYNFFNSDKRELKSIAIGYYIASRLLQELLEE